MYIPGWIFVIGILAFLVYYISRSEDELIPETIRGYIVIFLWLVALITLPLSLYLFYSEEWLWAFILLLPTIIASIFSRIKSESNIVIPELGLFRKNTQEIIGRLIGKHNQYVETIRDDIEKVKKERLKLENQLGFHNKLKQFFQDIKDYPLATGSWPSGVIKSSELLAEKLSQSFLSQLINGYYLTEGTDILNYCFQFDGKEYNLVFIKTFENYSSVLIYENKTDLVYKFSLEIEAFKPGFWLVYLMAVMNAVRLEQSKQSRASKEVIRQAKESDLKKNFLT
ncbi:MAG: hypothetical protein WC675_01870 [Patescibacteria group bacterium]|jgi:hypothetical protein